MPTFDIALPEQFNELLAYASFYQIDVPLDCVFPLDFHIRLVYKTMVRVAFSASQVIAPSLRDIAANSPARCSTCPHAQVPLVMCGARLVSEMITRDCGR